MYTSSVLMYLYYIYLLISAMMDLLSNEIPPKFYERLRPRILSKVGDRYGLLDVAWWEKDRQDGPFGPRFGPVPEQWWVVGLLGLLAF